LNKKKRKKRGKNKKPKKRFFLHLCLKALLSNAAVKSGFQSFKARSVFWWHRV